MGPNVAGRDRASDGGLSALGWRVFAALSQLGIGDLCDERSLGRRRSHCATLSAARCCFEFDDLRVLRTFEVAHCKVEPRDFGRGQSLVV